MMIKKITFVVVTALVSCSDKHPQTKPLNLEMIPKNWIGLTEQEGKKIIYQPCDSQNSEVKLIKNDSSYTILLIGGQDDFLFDIVKYELIGDSIKFKTTWEKSDIQQNFSFVWVQKEKGIGRWKTTFPNGFVLDTEFVEDAHRKSFETIVQPCVECWGDECDELDEVSQAQD